MKKLFALLMTCGLVSLTQPVFADTEFDPEDIIKYRQDMMTIIKNHNSNIKAIVNGKVPFKDHLGMHLGALEQLFTEIGRLFPEGSDFGDTRAKDAIWEKPEEFSQAIKDAQQALSAFKGVAQQGDKTKTADAYEKFGKGSCGGCHKTFRKKDD